MQKHTPLISIMHIMQKFTCTTAYRLANSHTHQLICCRSITLAVYQLKGYDRYIHGGLTPEWHSGQWVIRVSICDLASKLVQMQYNSFHTV